MSKNAARDIHRRYQYATDKWGLDARKPVFWAYEQPVHPGSQTSAFVFRTLEIIISRLGGCPFLGGGSVNVDLL